MTASASPATPQLAAPSPPLARRRRPPSSKSAPGAYRHRLRREESDPIADRELLVATLHLSESAFVLVPTPRQNTPATLKSP